jgi:hypothetical protein
MADNGAPHSNSPQRSTHETARIQQQQAALDERRAESMRNLAGGPTTTRMPNHRPGWRSTPPGKQE